jgi:hypothetical protein
MDSGTGITGGGSGYAAILAHAEGVLYGMELGSVTLKRVGFFCFPLKHSTHTDLDDDDPFIVLTETKFSIRYKRNRV